MRSTETFSSAQDVLISSGRLKLTASIYTSPGDGVARKLNAVSKGKH